jgi:hypothetical protein
MKIDDVYAGYIECALWSSLDDDGDNLDDQKYDLYEIEVLSLIRMKSDCDKFVEQAMPILTERTISDDELIGHDFWLTRNGHGAGFWDTPERWGGQENADRLSDIAKEFGECDITPDGGVFYLD